MKNFWSYITNGKYSVGTTGETVYLYDESGNKIKKFKDIKYGYTPMFSPDGKLFIVKSTEGKIAVYSLETFDLIKKFRFSKCDGGQDEGFCFSPDGKYFVNLEGLGKDGLESAVTLYNTEDFTIVSRLTLDSDMGVVHIEFDYITNEYYVLGLIRGNRISGFIAKYKNNAIIDKIFISENEYDFYYKYFDLKMFGFTEKAYEIFCFENDLEELKSMNYTLSELYNKYDNIQPTSD